MVVTVTYLLLTSAQNNLLLHTYRRLNLLVHNICFLNNFYVYYTFATKFTEII